MPKTKKEIVGSWECITINFNAPAGYNMAEEGELLEVSEKFEEELVKLIKKYNGEQGMAIKAYNSEGEVIS